MKWESIYVVDLGSVVKVGRSVQPVRRVHNHLDEHGIEWSRYWISPLVKHAVPMETHLIWAATSLYGLPVRGREYFDGDYDLLLVMTQQVAARPEFLW